MNKLNPSDTEDDQVKEEIVSLKIMCDFQVRTWGVKDVLQSHNQLAI